MYKPQLQQRAGTGLYHICRATTQFGSKAKTLKIQFFDETDYQQE